MQLGACLVERGEDEEAQRALERGCEVTSADDIVDVVGLAALEAVLRARRGELGEVQELARRALARADETDSIRLLLDTRWSAAEVFERAEGARAARRPGLGSQTSTEAPGTGAPAASSSRSRRWWSPSTLTSSQRRSTKSQ